VGSDVGLEGAGEIGVDNEPAGLVGATDVAGVPLRVELIPSVVAAIAKEFMNAKRKFKAFCLFSPGCGAEK
jgi:hypothetical protein